MFFAPVGNLLMPTRTRSRAAVLVGSGAAQLRLALQTDLRPAEQAAHQPRELLELFIGLSPSNR